MPSRLMLFTVATLTAAPAALAQQATRYTLTGDQVALYNIAGTVRIEPGSGSAVIAEVSLLGADREQLRVRANGRTLAVAYPADDIVYPALGRHTETDLRVADDGTFGGGWSRNGRQIRVRGDGEGLEAHADLRITVPAGKSVAVYLAVGRINAANVNGELLLDVASADIDVSGARGSLNLDLGSGDVTLRDLDLSLLELDAGSGTVSGSGIHSAEVRVDAGSGDIRLEDVASRDLSLDTGSGTVEISLTSDVDRLALDSGSGDVTIRAPADIGARVDIETGSGRVSGDLIRGLLRGEDDEDHISGSIGDGQGTITIDTGSGDVSFLSRR